DMTREVGIPGGCPIVDSIERARSLGAEAMILGIAPSGGRMPDSWRPDIERALSLGLSIVNGLHDPLLPTYESRLQPKQWIWDIRREPPDAGVAKGLARTLTNQRVLCVGTDMAIGKMTAALELWRA